MGRPFAWDVVAIASSRRCDTLAFAELLKAFSASGKKKAGAAGIGKATVVLPIPDAFSDDSGPVRDHGQVGSGGATLNALTHISESLVSAASESSAETDSEESSSDRPQGLTGKLVAVLLCSAGACDPVSGSYLGKAFAPIAADGDLEPVTSAELTLAGMLQIAASGLPAARKPCGVWVGSTEWVVKIREIRHPPHHPPGAGFGYLQQGDAGPDGAAPDVVVTALLADFSAAEQKNHGVYDFETGAGSVRRVLRAGLHRGTVARVGGQLPLVGPVVYLSPKAANLLVSLHTVPPFDRCTYFGSDSSAREALRVNLFFDLINASCWTLPPPPATDTAPASAAAGPAVPPLGGDRRLSSLSDDAVSILQRRLGGLKVEALVFATGPAAGGSPSHPSPVWGSLAYAYPASAEDWRGAMCGLSVPRGPGGLSGAGAAVAVLCKDESVSVGDGSVLSHCAVGPGAVVGARCCLYHAFVPPNATVPDGTVYSGVDPTAREGSQGCVQPLRRAFGPAEDGGLLDSLELAGFVLPHPGGGGGGDAVRNELELNEAVRDACALVGVRKYLRGTEASRTGSLGGGQGGGADAGSVGPLLARLARSPVADRAAVLRFFEAELAACEQPPALHLILHAEATFLWRCAVHDAALRGFSAGVRSGASRNPRWAAVLAAARDWDLAAPPAARRQQRLRWVAELATTTADFLGLSRDPMQQQQEQQQPQQDGVLVDLLVRCSRHLEGVAAAVTACCVGSAARYAVVGKAAEAPAAGGWIRASIPARIDLAGGWTDTPPVSYEVGGIVVNAAIQVDGTRPISAWARVTHGEHTIRFRELPAQAGGPGLSELRDFADYSSPHAPFALQKAVLIALGVVPDPSGKPGAGGPTLEDALKKTVGGGLELVTHSSLPVGSGLGGSSLMAAVIVACVAKVCGLAYDQDGLIHLVLKVEQMLTSGGGWQDQVGGVVAGVKCCTSPAELPLHVLTEPFPLSPPFLLSLNRHFVLVYTGRSRLARNLLQSVVRRWASRHPTVVTAVAHLKQTAEAVREHLQGKAASGATDGAASAEFIGKHLSDYWAQKQTMAGPGCEPDVVVAATTAWKDHLHGYSLCGAGGGGFLLLVTKQPDATEILKRVDFRGSSEISFHTVDIDVQGLTVEPVSALSE
ncbi:Bifunctional fucokinase/fucose pyrophosphorylase [Diplonema papillatum]|nr:Bifunctional fucokinase/fucose pyrophosphorylase [Diplonema papillatum]